MKGLILAGGSGSRLWPTTLSVSKQLLPVYGQPMIYYPLSTLISAGFRDIAIITAHGQTESFRKLLGDGSRFGIRIEYLLQTAPRGLADAFIVAENWLDGESSVLVLGDNLIFGSSVTETLNEVTGKDVAGSHVFAIEVKNANAYGVIEFGSSGEVVSLEEKPANPRSKYAIPGLYIFDNKAPERARRLNPSSRGEIEIVDLLHEYLADGELHSYVLERGNSWLDMGTPDALADATNYVMALEKRTGVKVGCPEESAWRANLIDDDKLKDSASLFAGSPYGDYLSRLF